MVAVSEGEPAGQVGGAGGFSVTVSVAATGTEKLVQLPPQLLVGGQIIKRLFETVIVPLPVSGIGKIGPGTDLVRTMDFWQELGAMVQVTLLLPIQANTCCGAASKAIQKASADIWVTSVKFGNFAFFISTSFLVQIAILQTNEHCYAPLTRGLCQNSFSRPKRCWTTPARGALDVLELPS
jgi:hypothetical protein